MRIISWDVGVIHLAYCIIECIVQPNGQLTMDIIDWDDLNLIEEDRIKLSCCGHIKQKKGMSEKICGKNASYFLRMQNGTNIGFCKTHLAQHSNYWSKEKTIELFSKIPTELVKSAQSKCVHLNKNDEPCGKLAKFSFNQCANQHVNQNEKIDQKEKVDYCAIHYRSALKRKLKEFSPQPIKNLIVRKYQTSRLQLELINKLDGLIEHFAKLGIEEVVIENQPAQKNPKMKSIANTLFDYFMIRGHVDHSHDLNITVPQFMCPSNKLKVNKDNTLEVFRQNKKQNKNSGKKYKLTKELSIEYTKQLLRDEPEQLNYLDLHKKQDDMCDAYLQGRYYLEFKKKLGNPAKPKSKSKPKSKPKPKRISGSKTNKKTLLKLGRKVNRGSKQSDIIVL